MLHDVPWHTILYTAPDDYTQSSAVEYTFTPGITSLDIPVVIADDDMFEQSESFQAQLATSRPEVIIDVPMTTVDISDNDCEWLVYLFKSLMLLQFTSLLVCAWGWEGGGGWGRIGLITT